MGLDDLLLILGRGSHVHSRNMLYNGGSPHTQPQTARVSFSCNQMGVRRAATAGCGNSLGSAWLHVLLNLSTIPANGSDGQIVYGGPPITPLSPPSLSFSYYLCPYFPCLIFYCLNLDPPFGNFRLPGSLCNGYSLAVTSVSPPSLSPIPFLILLSGPSYTFPYYFVCRRDPHFLGLLHALSHRSIYTYKYI